MTDPNEIIVDDGIKRTPAEDSPWGKFYLESIRLDKQNSSHLGSHWFSMLCILKDQGTIAKFDISAIQKILHDSHFHKKGGTHLHSYMNLPIRGLIRELGNPTTIEFIDLSNLSFDKIVNFSKLIFPIDVSFKNTKFLEDVHFNIAAFYKSANFNGTQFRKEANFKRTRFCRDTNFSNANFQNNATFVNAIFAGTTSISNNPNFTNVTFSGVANFMNIIFSDVAIFSNTNFISEGYFAESEFSKSAFFDNSKFSKRTDFYKVKFLNGAWFTSAKFFDNVSFDEAMFNDIIIFAGAEFFESAKFDKVTITGHTRFKNANFKKYVPSFYKADIYSDIIWDWNVKFWPSTGKHKDDTTDEAQETRITNNQNAYENLSSQMKGLDKYHDEHFFYRQEMCCRRWRSSPAVKFFYYLYEKLADYGYGIKQALWGWFWHMVLGTEAIVIVTFINACWKGWTWETAKGVLCSIPLSFANAHGFLPFHKGALKDCYELFDGNILFNIIWGFQTILGIVFLFLLLTTIRIRFRLK